MGDAAETLGQTIDEIDNLAHALTMPLPPHLHLEALRPTLPDLVKRMKAAYVGVVGENPWEDHPA